MPRRWLTAVLFALALAVQAIAPVANGVAAAHEAVRLTEICQKASDDTPQKAPGHTHRRHDCALCESFCDGAAAVAARPTSFGAQPVHWTLIHWTANHFTPPVTPRDFSRQARAPPRFA